MKQVVCRISTLLLLSICAGAASADERSAANASCRQETKQIVVWPPGPKAAPMTQVVTVCEAKVS